MENVVIFPRAFAFAVDDLGWNQGSDLSIQSVPGPFRAGVKRIFDLSDYRHLVRVAKAVGVRVQCLFILSEMDRENVLAKYPTTTFQRDRWNNAQLVNEDQLVIMNYVRDQAAFMEFGLHGTGHEYWANGSTKKRAEWYNLDDKAPWPEESLREHLKCFKDIMAQYGFTRENGHSFPESFVPCAYSYYWNPTGPYSLGKLLSEAGVKYANTDFSKIPELNPPEDINGGGFDFDTHVINRVNYGNLWYELSSLPRVGLEWQHTDVIESHWPNWLAQDDFIQPQVTRDWIAYYKSVQRRPDRYIAKNTEQLHSQWLYKRHTKISFPSAGVVEIDNSAMPLKAYNNNLLGNIVLKFRLPEGKHISSASLNGVPVAVYYEDEGFGFVYLPVLEPRRYTFQYTSSTEWMPFHIFHDGTYNVYDIRFKENTFIYLKMYGMQTLRVRCPRPLDVRSWSKELQVVSYTYHEETSLLMVTIQATDMQGSTGEIELQFF